MLHKTGICSKGRKVPFAVTRHILPQMLVKLEGKNQHAYITNTNTSDGKKKCKLFLEKKSRGAVLLVQRPFKKI